MGKQEIAMSLFSSERKVFYPFLWEQLQLYLALPFFPASETFLHTAKNFHILGKLEALTRFWTQTPESTMIWGELP